MRTVTVIGGVNGGQPRPRVVEVPPHDLLVEREVLHSAIEYPELIDSQGLHVIPDDFFSAQNGAIWQTLFSMRRAGVPIDAEALRSELDDRGLLNSIGGPNYLTDLTGGIPLQKPQIARLRRLGATRRVSSAAHALAIAARANEGIAEAADQLARAQKALADVDVPAEHPLERVWRPLGAAGHLHSAPLPRRWLLTRPNDFAPELAPVGVLQRGKVGFLVAEGGAGKTIALIQLSLSVATGRRWLDFFGCVPGRVCIALAEEDHDEMHRRFYALAKAMRLTDAQIAQADDNIVAVPLSGISARFLMPNGDRAPFLAELKRRLDDGRGPWSLIILDPLSRFAGADTEKDNAAATMFIEAAESLLSVPGAPSVLIAHHTNKLSRTEGAGLAAKAGNARGASALTDGARWACELQSRGDDGARLTVTKSNYASQGQPLDLIRDGDQGGYLRVATPAELARQIEAREQASESLAEVEDRRLEARILRVLTDSPGLSKTELQKRLHANRQAIARTVDALLEQRRLVTVAANAYAVAPPPGTQETLL